MADASKTQRLLAAKKKVKEYQKGKKTKSDFNRDIKTPAESLTNSTHSSLNEVQNIDETEVSNPNIHSVSPLQQYFQDVNSTVFDDLNKSKDDNFYTFDLVTYNSNDTGKVTEVYIKEENHEIMDKSDSITQPIATSPDMLAIETLDVSSTNGKFNTISTENAQKNIISDDVNGSPNLNNLIYANDENVNNVKENMQSLKQLSTQIIQMIDDNSAPNLTVKSSPKSKSIEDDSLQVEQEKNKKLLEEIHVYKNRISTLENESQSDVNNEVLVTLVDTETNEQYDIFVSQEDNDRLAYDEDFAQSVLERLKCKTPPRRRIKMWTYRDNISFLTWVKFYYKEFNDIHDTASRKIFWEKISNKLLTDNVNANSEECYVKWRNLLRTYRSCKNFKEKYGREPIRFQFFNEMENILEPRNTDSKSEIQIRTDTLKTDEIENERIQNMEELKQKLLEDEFGRNDASVSSSPTQRYVKIKYCEDKAEKKIWNYKETVCLIDYIRSYKERSFVIKPRDWKLISNNLLKQKFYATPTECATKWKNLLRTYRLIKQSKLRKTCGFTKFLFYDKIDEIIKRPDSINDEIDQNDLNTFTVTKWSYDVTVSFLKYFKLHYNEGNKNLSWNKISEELSKNDITISPKECAMKWNNLMKAYKKCDLSNTEEGRKSFSYWDEMIDILFAKNIIPKLDDFEVTVKTSPSLETIKTETQLIKNNLVITTPFNESKIIGEKRKFERLFDGKEIVFLQDTYIDSKIRKLHEMTEGNLVIQPLTHLPNSQNSPEITVNEIASTYEAVTEHSYAKRRLAKRKRKLATTRYIIAKSKYVKAMHLKMKNQIAADEEYRKQKLLLEERKVKALEELVEIHKNKNVAQIFDV